MRFRTITGLSAGAALESPDSIIRISRHGETLPFGVTHSLRSSVAEFEGGASPQAPGKRKNRKSEQALSPAHVTEHRKSCFSICPKCLSSLAPICCFGSKVLTYSADWGNSHDTLPKPCRLGPKLGLRDPSILAHFRRIPFAAIPRENIFRNSLKYFQ